MQIGIISDTHIPAAGKEPPLEVLRAFEGVDLILHAGHAYVPSCIEWLERIAPVRSSESWVEGIGENLSRVGRTLAMNLEGHTVGMAHELILTSLADDVLPGAIARNFPQDESLPLALEKIFGEPVDIVVFGYTYEAMVEVHDGVLFVNPGSPSLVGQKVKLGTVAVLELEPGSREARIINLAQLG